MSYKATIDMFINFSYIQVRFLSKQGYLRYRIKIYMKYQGKQSICHPYNIVKGPTKKQYNFLQEQEKRCQIYSEIDNDTLYYYSRLIPISYRPANYQENQTVFFKAYVNTEIIEDIEFYCTIQCLFTQNPEQPMQLVSKFQSIIRKINDVSTFLPVVLDVFQGFMIASTFHSTILQFKFSQDDFQTLTISTDTRKKSSSKQKIKRIQHIRNKCNDVYSYIEYITQSFNCMNLQKFYEYYREFLCKQHQSIQRRYNYLIEQIQKQNKLNLQQKIISVQISKNQQISQSIKSNTTRSGCIPLQQRKKIVELILKQYTDLKAKVYKKWMQFVNLVIKNSKPITKYYRKQYQILCKQRFKNNVFSHKIKNHDWKLSKYQDSGKINLQQAFKEKKKINTEQELWKQHFSIQNITYFGKSETNVKIFQEIYCTNAMNLSETKYKPRHIIVLVHGFQATRQDFMLLKNCLQVVYGAHVIISTCNQGQTQHSIIVAGKRLASQIKKILTTQNGEFRLSFIGHSMGGLIIRSAIPDLIQFKDKFYTYLTFSTPHLGYLYQSSAIIKVGLWILSSWQKIQALQQLTMKDNNDLRQTVLYRLCKNDSLKQFKKLCFVSSTLDQYVCYQSARVQQNQKLMIQTLGKNVQQIIKQMVNGIIGDIKSPEISRINVVFNIEDKNWDSFLGRAGHIKFLSDIQFIREFCSCFDKFFA